MQLAERQRAVELIANALNERLEAMNEFRKQISDERALYVKMESHTDLRADVESLKRWQSNITGKIAAVGAVMTVVWAVLLKFWR